MLRVSVHCTDLLLALVSTHRASLPSQSFIKEIIVAVVFVLGYLVVPEVLKVNKQPTWIAWVLLLPLLLVRVPDQATALSPASIYALWYGSRDLVMAKFQQDSIQYEHVFGPLLGGFFAGAMMVGLFPDEPAWNPA